MDAVKLTKTLVALAESSAVMTATARKVEPLVERVTELCKSVRELQVEVQSQRELIKCLDGAVGLGNALKQKLTEVVKGWSNYESSVQKFIDNKISGPSEYKEVADDLNDAFKSCQSFGETLTEFCKKLPEAGKLAQKIIGDLENEKRKLKEKKKSAESMRDEAGAVAVGGSLLAVAAWAILTLVSGGATAPVMIAGTAAASAAAVGGAVCAVKSAEVAKLDQILEEFNGRLLEMKELSSSINNVQNSWDEILDSSSLLRDSFEAALKHLKDRRQKEIEGQEKDSKVEQLENENQEKDQELKRAIEEKRRADEENERLRQKIGDMMKK